MNCDHLDSLAKEVLLYVDADKQNKVLDIFAKYKHQHLTTPNDNDDDDTMEADDSNETDESLMAKEEKRQHNFYKALIESLESTPPENSSSVVMTQYNTFSDLLKAIKETKRQLDKSSNTVLQKSVELGRLFWVSKRFKKFDEAFRGAGYTRAWANFLIKLYDVQRRHPNVYKSSMPLHVLRSNFNYLFDIEEYLPEFDKFE